MNPNKNNSWFINGYSFKVNLFTTFNLKNFLLSDFIACLLCLLGYAVDFDIACTGDGEAIGNASLELSHMGYDFTLLFLASMIKPNYFK